MCGIAGLLDFTRRSSEESLTLRARAMANALAHRGPDGDGVWSDRDAGIALAHRRLSIIDLSDAGRQPMISSNGRWIASYNGEIYNAEALRRLPELAGVDWRGHSDTEVMLESVSRRGLPATVQDLDGMFAIALWDRSERMLHLVRDRIGIKPLFFSQVAGTFRFASELRCFSEDRQPLSIDGASVASYLRFGYVPTPFSIFKDVGKVRPGEIVSINSEGKIERSIYWSIRDRMEQGRSDPFRGSDEEAIEALDALLSHAVSSQMMSDVPLGAFLSGGIDSSAVAAMMMKAGRGPVRTFSIGSPDRDFDEGRYAAMVARHLGTRHEELKATPEEALAVVPHLADIYDEPFADSSQIPTHLLSRLTRGHVVVALSGDGGDELFAGYNRYSLAQGLNRHLLNFPSGLRGAAASALKAVSPERLDRWAKIIPASWRPAQAGDKLHKLADILPLDRDAVYLRLVSQYPYPERLTNGFVEHAVNMQFERGDDRRFLESMQLFDTETYLPDDILQKVDRASMSVSLEVRPPFLNHRVVEFACRLPRRLKVRAGESKWLLRRVLDRYVPRPLVDRPKMGFAIPLAQWLRGPLQPWADDLIHSSDVGGGYLNVEAVRSLWSEHMDGRRNWAYALWTVLMFEIWRRRWQSVSASTMRASA